MGPEPSATTKLRSSRGFAWASRWTTSLSSRTIRQRTAEACGWSTPATRKHWWAPAAGDPKRGATGYRRPHSKPGPTEHHTSVPARQEVFGGSKISVANRFHPKRPGNTEGLRQPGPAG